MTLDVNSLNEKTSHITRKYAEAKRGGFLIEALVLFNYMLRHKLLIIINNKLIETREPFKERYLKNETNQLSDIAMQKGAISKELRDDLNTFYGTYRSRIIHEMLTGEIDYTEMQLRMNESLKLLNDLQEYIIGKIKIGEIEEDN